MIVVENGKKWKIYLFGRRRRRVGEGGLAIFLRKRAGNDSAALEFLLANKPAWNPSDGALCIEERMF
jgi:hypothetical protein